MLPLFCVTTGISHRVQLAILVNFPNAVLNATRSILKKVSDVLTFETFCYMVIGYRDQSFINRRGVGYFFTEGEVLNRTRPPQQTQSKKK